MSEIGTPLRPQTERIHALTSLRFFAALWVVVFHTMLLPFGNLRGTLADRIISFGYTSVSFFFLLSGYILAIVYLAHGRPIKKKDFYAARLARVYPLFAITLLFDAPFVVYERASQFGWARSLAKTSGTLVIHIFMLQAWLPWLRGIDQPNWSLSVETVFYLAFPFLGVLFWRLRGALLGIVAASIWIVNQLVVALILPHVSKPTITFHPLLHLSTFSLGILLARWQISQREKVGAHKPSRSQLIVAWMAGLSSLIIAMQAGDTIASPYWNAGLLTPGFALILWACTGNESLIVRALSVKWLVVLGEASFGLYLIHVPLNHLFKVLGWKNSRPHYPVYLGACIGLSLISFYFFEVPTRKWLLRQFGTRTRETIEIASDAQ